MSVVLMVQRRKWRKCTLLGTFCKPFFRFCTHTACRVVWFHSGISLLNTSKLPSILSANSVWDVSEQNPTTIKPLEICDFSNVKQLHTLYRSEDKVRTILHSSCESLCQVGHEGWNTTEYVYACMCVCRGDWERTKMTVCMKGKTGQPIHILCSL